MSKFTKFGFLLALLTVVGVSACNKKRDTVAPSFKHLLIRAQQDVNNYWDYLYNADGAMTQMSGLVGNFPIFIKVSYNANKQISAVLDSNSAVVGGTSVKFIYDANKLITKLEYYQGTPGSAMGGYADITNTDGTISEVKSYYAASGSFLPGVRVTLTYNNGGDVISEKYYEWNTSTKDYNLSQTRVFEYDNNPNPLRFTADVKQLFFESTSVHNVIKETDYTAENKVYMTATCIYNYDSAGYPTFQKKSTYYTQDAVPAQTQTSYLYKAE